VSETRRPQSRAEREEARARPGLDAWAGFPADRRPRPLVLLSETARPGGFPTGQAKQAFHDGLVTAGPDFPAPVLRALRRPPRGGREVPPLLLTRATLGETWFDTDRGRQTLPAWCVWAQDVTAPVWVLDPATAREAWQPPGWVPGAWHHEEAAIDADDRTLTFEFTGGHERSYEYSGARVLESGNAVALIPNLTKFPTGPHTLAGYRRQVTAALGRPLGHRVLLDQRGRPVKVTSPAPV
jgi:hypothetical protein